MSDGKQHQELKRLREEHTDLLYQCMDDDMTKNKLQVRLDDALEQLRTFAEITQEQEKAMEWLIERNQALETSLRSSRVSLSQAGGSAATLPSHESSALSLTAPPEVLSGVPLLLREA